MAGIPLSFSIWLRSITKISGFSIPELSFFLSDSLNYRNIVG